MCCGNASRPPSLHAKCSNASSQQKPNRNPGLVEHPSQILQSLPCLEASLTPCSVCKPVLSCLPQSVMAIQLKREHVKRTRAVGTLSDRKMPGCREKLNKSAKSTWCGFFRLATSRYLLSQKFEAPPRKPWLVENCWCLVFVKKTQKRNFAPAYKAIVVFTMQSKSVLAVIYWIKDFIQAYWTKGGYFMAQEECKSNVSCLKSFDMKVLRYHLYKTSTDWSSKLSSVGNFIWRTYFSTVYFAGFVFQNECICGL